MFFSASLGIGCACVEGRGRSPKGVRAQLANANFHRGPQVRTCVGEGGSPKGLVCNLLMQSFTVGTSKIQYFKNYFFDIVTTQNDHRTL